MSQKNIQENLSQKIKEDLKDNPKVDVEKVSSFLSSGVPNMDDHNQKAAKVWSEKGVEEAVKFMFQHPTEKDEKGNPRKMSYSEMRYYYG